MKISGWGLFPSIDAKVFQPSSTDELIKLIKSGNLIARGNGRSYGDSSINKNNTIDMKKFNKIISFDDNSGQLVTQAGVLLSDVIDEFLQRGWFPKVTPGSKFVTIGGMVAADVHGKNHHKDGSFGNWVDWIDIINSDGEIERCSKNQNKELFNWTLGGMGLTGVILNVAFKLKRISSAWIKKTVLSSKNLQETVNIFEKKNNSTYSVAWIDCLSSGANLGRSLLILGEHAECSELPAEYKKNPFKLKRKKKIKIPFYLPNLVLNKFTIRIFNSFYYWLGKYINNKSYVDWDSYFYPLDKIIGWNKIYGKRGLIQFQCVIPTKNSFNCLTEMCKLISKSDCQPFLSVLKKFGKQDGYISFPQEGYTLALDFAVSKKNLDMMNRLDKIVLKYNGRFYLAKDSRMTAETLKSSDDRIQNFINFRKLRNNFFIFKSEQSKRLKS